jgi:sugar phosphate isomerase/epimerase
MAEPVHLPAGEARSVPAAPLAKPDALLIGNQTAFSAGRLLEPFEYALANRFAAFEWFPDKRPDGAGWEHSDLDPPLRAEIRRAARANSLRLSVHGRGLLAPLRSEPDPFLSSDMELAEDLGAAALVLHLCPEVPMADFARALLGPLDWAARNRIQLALENTPAAAPEQFGQLFYALAELNPPELPWAGMCLDIGHANLCPATRNDYLAYLDQLDPAVPITHLHVHENWGDTDSHLTLFTGPSETQSQGVTGLLRRLRRRGYAGSLILEQWPLPPSLLNRARDRLLEIWQSLEVGDMSQENDFVTQTSKSAVSQAS